MDARLFEEAARLARRIREKATDPVAVRKLADQLKVLAEQGQREIAQELERARKISRNPAQLVAFVNPGRGRGKSHGLPIGSDVVALVYRHAQDGGHYVHAFGGVDDQVEIRETGDELKLRGLARGRTGVSLEGLADGSARIFNREGKPVWKDL